MLCRACLRRQLRLELSRAVIWTRQASTQQSTRPATIDSPERTRFSSPSLKSDSLLQTPRVRVREPQENYNSHSLVTKIKHLVGIGDLDEALHILQKARYPGAEYSWNLLIKHYSSLFKYSEAHRIYNTVHSPLKNLVDW